MGRRYYSTRYRYYDHNQPIYWGLFNFFATFIGILLILVCLL
jgi:hypothetical protein